MAVRKCLFGSGFGRARLGCVKYMVVAGIAGVP